MTDPIQRAARAIHAADGLVIAAGAGMGVDSGLPDFRGPAGFWNAYPPYRKLGLGFTDMADPRWFSEDPPFAWGFYGHRTNLYRATVPHAGFDLLLKWAQSREHAVFTSNVDGQFQAAGFPSDCVFEVHGSIHHLQCSVPCGDHIWSGGDAIFTVDDETMRAVGEVPQCGRCGATARPNILMFGDWTYQGGRADRQQEHYRRTVSRMRQRSVVVIEMGAGTAVPTVRWECERRQAAGAALVRINPRESQGPPGTIGIDTGAAEALAAIDVALQGL